MKWIKVVFAVLGFSMVTIIVLVNIAYVPFVVNEKLRLAHDPHPWNLLVVLLVTWSSMILIPVWVYFSGGRRIGGPVCASLVCSFLFSMGFWASGEYRLSLIKTWEGECKFLGAAPMAMSPRTGRPLPPAVALMCNGNMVEDTNAVLRASIGEVPKAVHCKLFAEGNYECRAR